MEHSPKFEKVKYYYDHNLWTKTQVNQAVTKYWITESEYEEIIGEPYIPINKED